MTCSENWPLNKLDLSMVAIGSTSNSRLKEAGWSLPGSQACETTAKPTINSVRHCYTAGRKLNQQGFQQILTAKPHEESITLYTSGAEPRKATRNSWMTMAILPLDIKVIVIARGCHRAANFQAYLQFQISLFLLHFIISFHLCSRKHGSCLFSPPPQHYSLIALRKIRNGI